MDELIKQAMELDKEAREQVLEAKAQKNNVHELLRKKKKQIQKEYMDEADQKEHNFIGELTKRLEAQKIKNDNELEKSISILEKRYEDKKTIWVEAIVENVSK